MAKQASGTKPRLSPDVIVSSALALADAEGLDALTIRRLAQEHGVTPMAMYWHFNDKEALLDGIAEHLITAVELPAPTDEPWDVQLRAILRAFLVAIRPHPNVAGLALKRILACESGLAMAEQALGLLREAGFSAEKAAELGSFLLFAVITMVTSEPGPHDGVVGEAREEMIRQKSASLTALSPTRYPNVRAAGPALVACVDAEEYFRTNIDLLVSGVRGVLPA
jgi:TetR/AcrR family tetracycline transcriptional repressor